jgi:hypothetical protein
MMLNLIWKLRCRINVLAFFEPVERNMMIRLVMFLLLTALILTGASAFVQRGWQVTHATAPTAKLSRAEPVEIVASLYAWATSTPESQLPALVKTMSDRAPWLPTTSLHQAGVEIANVAKDVLHSDTVTGATAWVKDNLQQLASAVGLGGTTSTSVVAETPAPKPAAVAPVAPTPASAPPPASAPVVAAHPVAGTQPAPVPVVVAQAPAPAAPSPAPVKAAPAPAPVAPAKVAQTSPTLPLPPPATAAKPTGTESAGADLWSAGSWSVSQKGCAIGGVAGTGATLLIGPAEIAAWATGAAAVLPATVRIVGTVIGAALVTGCAAGALVAPVVSK